MIRKEIFDVIHKTIYQFIDGEDNVEEPMSDKDKLLLEVNKAICNNLKALEQESILDKIRAEIEAIEDGISSYHNDRPWIFKDEALAIIDKYRTECAGEWLESEYKEQSTTNAIPIQDKIKEILDGYDGSMPSMITQFNEIQKLIKSED